jgi:hypothetical protein
MSAHTNFFGEPGEPVPAVSPADIKRAWEAREAEEKRREAAGETGLHAVAGGSESLSQAEIENRRAVGYRSFFLWAFMRYNEHVPWIENGQPNDVLLRTFAEIPMEWMGVGVTRVGPPFDQDEFMRRLNDPHQ